MIFIRKFVMLIPILLLILIGCSATTQLEPPTNFRYEAGFLYWTEIKGAEHYVVEINGTNKLAYNNKLDLKDYGTGNYTARIASFSKGELSSFTPFIQFQLIQSESLTGITLTQDTIDWEVISGLGYLVTITDVVSSQVVISQPLLQNSYNYSNLADGSYDVEIKALLDTTEISSIRIRFEKGDFTYIRSAGLILDQEEITNIAINNQLLVLDEDYTMDEFGIIVESDWIDALEVGFVLMTIENEQTIYRYVEIKTIDIPVIVSSSSTTYLGVDVVFTFDLKGGSFQGLGGNNIAFEDYTFINNTLTIRASYIDEVIALDTSRKMLILTYVLQNDPHVVIGYLFISIP
jgi:hypothetical protein